MRLSQAFQPTLRETPVEAKIVSHQLMLRAGLIRQIASGIYVWLPAGLRVLRKISTIIQEEQDRIGGQELLMPTLQPAELWKKSGRHDSYGPEMLRFKDRHDRELLYGPTNEEMITEIFGATETSYKTLPKYLYQIQWKFRDEIRPRFGVMRGREFLMKDGYSFDLSAENAEEIYFQIMHSYLRTFERLGVTAIPMAADTGPIGGALSHEFLVLAPTGESEVFYDKRREIGQAENVDNADPKNFLKALMQDTYAATSEKHDIEAWDKIPEAFQVSGRAIEVGHIFSFGTKYTETMGISVAGPNGDKIYPHMGSYGIGVSRLVGAIIEASHDEKGIIWPKAIAPYQISLINLRPGDENCDRLCEEIYKILPDEILYDDRKERAGVKFNDADLMGAPWKIVVGPKGAARGEIELSSRAGTETFTVNTETPTERDHQHMKSCGLEALFA
ncbi:proline--tRNA ligase [Acetobacteraceae bacterium]|nr:proline--tRNA ligase [Acetobacteraceae bacterium]